MNARSRACHVAALTHRGAVRDLNEDVLSVDDAILGGDMNQPIVSFLRDDQHVLMVADGMGGHAYGGFASRAALEALVSVRNVFTNESACVDALVAVNDRIYDLMWLRPDTLGMGTTIVGIALLPPSLIHFNVGDSRAYRFGHGGLIQLSHDDTPLASTSSGRRSSHQISQSLGGRFSRSSIIPHVGAGPPLEPGEALLLCSDGLTDMVDQKDVSEILRNSVISCVPYPVMGSNPVATS
jgi:serine/threonine protein phosphatase PrpC